MSVPVATTVSEHIVRVPPMKDHVFNVMKFSNSDVANWRSGSMSRDRRFAMTSTVANEPVYGAGSEFGRKERMEAFKRKQGHRITVNKVSDLPWALKVKSKTTKPGTSKETNVEKKFVSKKEGGIANNAKYFVLAQKADGSFEAFPVENWYSFTPAIKHRTLDAEEAEEEFERRDKILNKMNLMAQKRKTDHPEEDDIDEKMPKKKGGLNSKIYYKNDLQIPQTKSSLKVSDFDEWLEESSGEEIEYEDKEKKLKSKVKCQKARNRKLVGGKLKKKKEHSDEEDEALEESDDGDQEGQEMDYDSDTSDDFEDIQLEQKLDEVKENIEDINEESESSSSEEDTNLVNSNTNEDSNANDKKKQNDSSSGEEEDSGDSDEDPDKIKSALFLAGSDGKEVPSPSNSRSSTPKPTKQDRVAAALASSKTNTEAGTKRKISSLDDSVSKKSRLEPVSNLIAGEDFEMMIKKYVQRKPMTTSELVQKVRKKDLGLDNDKIVKLLVHTIKKLELDSKKVGDKTYWSLKTK